MSYRQINYSCQETGQVFFNLFSYIDMNEFWIWIYRVATYAWIKKEDKYLIAQRSFKESFMPWYWSLVWWKLETNWWYNVLEDNLQKEILEEVWIEVWDVQFIWNYCDISRSIVYIVYAAERRSWEAKPLDDMDDIRRLTVEELKTFKDDNLFSTYLPFINK